MKDSSSGLRVYVVPRLALVTGSCFHPETSVTGRGVPVPGWVPADGLLRAPVTARVEKGTAGSATAEELPIPRGAVPAG